MSASIDSHQPNLTLREKFQDQWKKNGLNCVLASIAADLLVNSVSFTTLGIATKNSDVQLVRASALTFLCAGIPMVFFAAIGYRKLNRETLNSPPTRQPLKYHLALSVGKIYPIVKAMLCLSFLLLMHQTVKITDRNFTPIRNCLAFFMVTLPLFYLFSNRARSTAQATTTFGA